MLNLFVSSDLDILSFTANMSPGVDNDREIMSFLPDVKRGGQVMEGHGATLRSLVQKDGGLMIFEKDSVKSTCQP